MWKPVTALKNDLIPFEPLLEKKIFFREPNFRLSSTSLDRQILNIFRATVSLFYRQPTGLTSG